MPLNRALTDSSDSKSARTHQFVIGLDIEGTFSFRINRRNG